MPEQTTNLKLPLPLGNETVNRQFFLDLINAIDSGAVSQAELTEALKGIVIKDASTDQKGIVQLDNTVGGSNSIDKAVVPKALLDSLALKQDVIRLADNYLAASVLVNAAPDTAGRAYPNGVSMFKVTSAAGGWPAANGYVLTFRAGSGGYQIFYEMYTGNVQTDKTARQWTRSKRDSNTFWQEFARVLTEVDQNTLQTNINTLQTKVDNPRANLLPNGTFNYGKVGWSASSAATFAGWATNRSASEAGAEISYAPATTSLLFLESTAFPLFAGGTYHVSAEFYAEGYVSSDFWIEVVGLVTGGGTSVLTSVLCASTDRWTRRGKDIVIPATVSAAVIRLVVAGNKGAGFKGFRRIQVTAGPGAQPFNDMSDGEIARRADAFLEESRSIELGRRVPGDGQCFIDFHTSAAEVDFNARIIAANGNVAGIGAGSLTYAAAAGHYFDAPVFVQGTDLKKSVIDGKAAVRAAINRKNVVVGDADGDGVPTHAELATAVDNIVLGYKVTPGETQLFGPTSGTNDGTSGPIYIRAIRITVQAPGTYRLRYALSVNAYYGAYAQVRRNGQNYGTLRYGAPATYTNFVEDLYFAAGEAIEVWIKVDLPSSGGQYGADVANFRLLGASAPYYQ